MINDNEIFISLLNRDTNKKEDFILLFEVNIGDYYYSGGKTTDSIHLCDSERLKTICEEFKARKIIKANSIINETYKISGKLIDLNKKMRQ